MPNKITNIHDKFIKDLLSDNEVAVDFLKEYLPKEIQKHLKFDTIKLEPTSYISTEMEESFSDIVWQIDTDKESVKVCLLLEHKSYKDSKVVFQVLEYLALAYRKQLKTKEPISLVLPILYYHGKEKWELEDIVSFFKKYPSEFQKYIPNFQSEFINLANMSEEQILNLQNGLLASALLIQLHYSDSENLIS